MTQTYAATQMHVATDRQIQTAIITELDWSPLVESEHVGVAVTDGAVTLSGEVLTLLERNAAVNAAMRIHSVIALVDEIVVNRGDGRHNDADIAREASRVLGHHVQLIGTPISATVHRGVITLTGTVDWSFERETARAAVASLAGVVEVVNDTVFRATTVPGDAEDRIPSAPIGGAATASAHTEVVVTGHRVTAGVIAP